MLYTVLTAAASDVLEVWRFRVSVLKSIVSQTCALVGVARWWRTPTLDMPVHSQFTQKGGPGSPILRSLSETSNDYVGINTIAFVSVLCAVCSADLLSVTAIDLSLARYGLAAGLRMHS